MLVVSERDDDGVAQFDISTGENVIELLGRDELVAESFSRPIASIQPAGVGGTGPNGVPV